MKAYVDALAQMKLQQRQLERDLHRTFFSNRLLATSDSAMLDDYQRELDMKRAQAQSQLFAGITRVKTHVKSVNETVSAFVTQTNEQGPGANYDYVLGELRNTIDSIEGELTDFKESSRVDYDQLALEGKELEGEMDHLLERFESWKNLPPPAALPPTAPIGRGKPASSPLQQEIVGIDKQIAELGGKNLGWEDADTAEFLKTFTRHKGKLTPAFLHDCKNVLPYYSEEDIRSHFEKHKMMLELTERKKGLLTKWKMEKERMKTEKQAQVEEVAAPPQPRRAQSVQSNRDTKTQLEDWKRRRAEEQALEAQRKAAEETAKRRSKLQSREETDQKRQQIAEYRERKQIAETQKQLIADYERRRSQVELSETDKARLREREERLREQRSVQILSKKQKEEEKRQREFELQMRTKVAWSHVESKLEEETTASLRRKEAKRTENRADTFGGVLVRTTGRAIPNWRAGLNQ